jgi:hypothetical protein
VTRLKREVETALRRKGFQPTSGDHTYFYLHTQDGKRTPIFTKTSHGSKPKDLDDYLLGQMAKQCRLSRKDFLRLIDCPLDRNAYEDLLRTGNHL